MNMFGKRGFSRGFEQNIFTFGDWHLGANELGVGMDLQYEQHEVAELLCAAIAEVLSSNSRALEHFDL
jgi:hypothetical protein